MTTTGATNPTGPTNRAEKSDGLLASRLVRDNVFLLGMIWAVALFMFLAESFGAVLIFLPLVIIAVISNLVQFTLGLAALRTNPGAGLAATLTAPLYLGASLLPVLPMMAGLAWGRPLRVRGRQLFPGLREGSDWTRGERPDASALDPATREALAALWLHDAQKEHASVPAFSRISWMLAAVGAPAHLMEWAHHCGLQEIEHTRICFALAAGYGGQSFSVEPMPELLLGGWEPSADPIVTLAIESLSDGCQLEDFNADVAHECAVVCEEPVTRAVLRQIARDERNHAEFAWALLAWAYERSPHKVAREVERTLTQLDAMARPSAASRENREAVARANPAALRRHGRLSDERIAELWKIRLSVTRHRLASMVGSRTVPRAESLLAPIPRHGEMQRKEAVISDFEQRSPVTTWLPAE